MASTLRLNLEGQPACSLNESWRVRFEGRETVHALLFILGAISELRLDVSHILDPHCPCNRHRMPGQRSRWWRLVRQPRWASQVHD